MSDKSSVESDFPHLKQCSETARAADVIDIAAEASKMLSVMKMMDGATFKIYGNAFVFVLCHR